MRRGRSRARSLPVCSATIGRWLRAGGPTATCARWGRGMAYSRRATMGPEICTAPSGTGGWGTTVFAASSIRPVIKKAMTSRSARGPLPTSSRPVASESVATATNSTPPATEVTHPTASRSPESVLLARSSIRTSMSWNSPAPAAAEQTRNAAVESSRISLLSPFTSSQVIRAGDTKAPGPSGQALL